MDWDRERAKNDKSANGEIPCVKCGSKKTFAIEQQTEDVDDEIDLYIECLECSHKMRK